VAEELEKLKTQVKENIISLINNNKLQEAQSLLNQYVIMVEDDPDSFSMQAVIEISQGHLDDAKVTIERGLLIQKNNFDLLYNLAFVHELKKDYKQAAKIYSLLKDGSYSDEQKNISAVGLVRICDYCSPDIENKSKPKLVFFVKQGMDSFLENIFEELSGIYETKKIIVTQYNQIDEAMAECDICWFEWCDELMIHASKLEIAKEKKIICRLHSYEAFIDYPAQVNWDAVDKVIFVADHIRDVVLENAPSLSKDKTIIISNGINVNNYSFKKRKPGFKIAYLGYINYKKGPMLLLHAFKAICDKDSRYKLYIAGTFQDLRYVLYFRQMIAEMGLEKNVFYQGWQDNVDQWLEDKDYILLSSVLEGHPVAIMQAMAKGIKPLIHNFVGARAIYPGEYIWNTFSECISLLKTPYDSKKIRQFIEENYSLSEQITKLKEEINLLINPNNMPLVTIGIINYNNARYLTECVESFIKQNYPNLEIIIVDDLSTDNSQLVIKELQEKYQIIKSVLHEVNSGGPSMATQEIISFAQGKYVQWISSDDFVMPGSINKFVNYLEQNSEVDYVYSNFNIVNEKSEFKDQWVYREYSSEEIIYNVFHTGSGVLPTICLFKTDYFRKNNIQWLIYRNNDLHSDTLNSLHFLTYNFKYKKVDDYLICYRMHDSNISYSIKMRIKGAISIFDYIIKHFDHRVYLPEINWDSYENIDDAKILVLADFYYKQAKHYINNVPDYIKSNSFAPEEINQYVYPFVREAYKYIYSASEKNIYIKQITQLKQLLGDFGMDKVELVKSVKELGSQVALLNRNLSNEGECKNSAIKRQRIGYVDFIKMDHLDEKSLIRFHKNIFSQAGQDGILEEIFLRLGLESGLFVEFGGWDGVYLSNARYLALQGWAGVFIEADAEKYKELRTNYKDNDEIIAVNKFVGFDGENTLDKILAAYGITEVDFLSIDIDGLDYKILENINIKPKVILMEGGAAFSPFLNARVPDEVAQNNLSQPLPIIMKIAARAGYVAVCFFQDVYLVRKDLANKFIIYNEDPIKLYSDWFLSLPSFNQNYMTNYVRRDSEDCVVKLIERDYFKTYSTNPLGYSILEK